MNKLLMLILMSVVVFSCEEEESGLAQYRDGVFVVNQGSFGSGTGTITFLDADGSDPIANAYSANNDGRVLGNVVQSMEEFEGHKFFAVNNAATIIIAKDRTLEFVDSITSISQPRYFSTDSDRLFVSSWGDGFSGAVSEINADGDILETINLGNGPEGMAINDNKLYVAKGGGFSRDSLLVVIDLVSFTITQEIVVGDNPEQVIVRDNGDILVLANGYSDFYDPSQNTAGSISILRNEAIVNQVEIPQGSNRLAYDPENDVIFYVSQGEVVKRAADLSTSPERVIDISAYGLAYNDETELLYVADAKDFNSSGEIIVIDNTNTEVRRETVGVIPGFFHFD